MSQQKIDELFVEQLEIGKHLRIRSPVANLDIHRFENGLGVWLSKKGSQAGENSIGAYAGDNAPGPYFMLYPEKSFFNEGVVNKLPFAFSTTDGIQVPHPDGTHTRISLKQLSELVRALNLG